MPTAIRCTASASFGSWRWVFAPVTVYHSAASLYCTFTTASPLSSMSVRRVRVPVTTPTSSVMTPPGPVVMSSAMEPPVGGSGAGAEHLVERRLLGRGDRELPVDLDRDPSFRVGAPVGLAGRFPGGRVLVALGPVLGQ